MEKKIYSLNLSAYIQKETGIEPNLDFDGRLIYCVFPEIDAVSIAIEDYKRNEELHDFLQSYRDLRNQVKEVKRSK